MKKFLTLCAVMAGVAGTLALLSGMIDPCEPSDKHLTGLVNILLGMHFYDWAQKS